MAASSAAMTAEASPSIANAIRALMSVALHIVAVLSAALALAGCGRSETYRYKLTLSLDTPDGVKTASNVVEINAFDVIIPARGIGHKTTGQALYIDLGAGRRPLIALFTRIRRATDPWPTFPGWGEDAPGETLADKCLGAKKPEDWPRRGEGDAQMRTTCGDHHR